MKNKKLILLLLTCVGLFGCEKTTPSDSSQSSPSSVDSMSPSTTPSSEASSVNSTSSTTSSTSSTSHVSETSSMTSSTSNSSVDSSSSSDSSSVVPVSEKTEILNQFNEVVSASSYTVKMKSSSKRRSDEVFTEQYILRGSTSNGYVLLNDIDTKGQKMVYKYDLVNDEVEIKHAEVRRVNGQRQAVRDMSVLNPLSALKNYQNHFESFLERDSDGFKTEDQNLIYVLAELLGYQNYAEEGNFPVARVYLDSSNRLSFTLQSTPDYISLEDFASGTFADVNSSKDDRIANFITAPSFYDPMYDDMLAPLMEDAISLSSNIFMTYLDDGEVESIGYSEVDLSNDCLKIKIVDDGANTTDDLFLVKDENNYASKVFLNAKNELEYEPTSTKWDEIDYPKDILKAGSFYKIKEDTYRYYGLYAAEAFQAMAYVSLGDIESLDVVIKNGQLISFNFTFENSKDMMGFDVYYSVQSSVISYRNPQTPEKVADDEDTAMIAQSLAHISSATTYTVKMYDARQKDIYTQYQVTDKVILKQETYPRPGEMDVYDVLTTGYVLASDGSIIPISVDKNGVVKASGNPIYDTTLDELFGFNAAANLFYNYNKEGESYYGLKSEVYKIHEYIFGGTNLKNYNYETFLMIYDENQYITTIKYGYTINGQITGNEIVELSKYGTTIIDEAILSQIDDIAGYVEPVNWKDEEVVYNALVECFGEEIANIIPYLYDETLASKWNAFYTKKAFYIDINSMGLFEDPTNYMERYRDLLKNTEGFVEDVDANGNTIYVYNDEIAIFVDASPCLGITITILE